MDRKEILDKIVLSIEELNKIKNRIQHSSAVNDIEIELINRELLDLYKLIQETKSSVIVKQPVVKQREQAIHPPRYEPAGQRKAEPQPTQTAKAQEPIEKEFKPEPVELSTKPIELNHPEPVTHPVDNPVHKAPVEHKTEHAYMPTDEDVATKSVTTENNETQPPKKSISDLYADARKASDTGQSKSGTLNEKLQNRGTSLNEKLANQQGKKNLAEKLKLSPIADLKTAIGINQRAAFVQNLFGGDDKAFKKAITFVNDSRNFAEAKSYLQSEVARQYNWKEENPSVQDFMELVYRKFL